MFIAFRARDQRPPWLNERLTNSFSRRPRPPSGILAALDAVLHVEREMAFDRLIEVVAVHPRYSLNTFFSGAPKLGALGAHVSIDFRTIAGDGLTAWPEMMYGRY